MQGQKSAFGSLPEVIAFDHGSTSSDAGFDQQMSWTNVENSSQARVPDFLLSSSDTNRGHLNAANHPGHDFYRWDFPESSSRSAQVEIGENDQNTEHEWPAPMRVGAGSMIISDQQYQPSNREDANQTLLSRDSGSRQPPHDLNVNYEMDDDDNDHDDDCQVLEYPHVLNSSGPRIEQPPFASSSSNPFGAPRYLVDEIDGRPGCSLDGQRLSCKRKSPEGNLGQPSDGGSTSSTQPTQTSLNFSTPEQVNPRLGLSFGQVASDSFPSLYAGASSSSRRNFRLRINAAHQQGSVSNTMFTPNTDTGNTSSNQSSRLLPSSNLLDLRSVSMASNVGAEGQPVPVRVPSLRPVSQSRWNGSASFLASGSGPRNAAQHVASTSTSMPRSIADYPITVPPSEPRSSLQSVPPSWGLPGVNVDVSGDVASASRTSTGSGSGSGSWVPHQIPSHNPNRLAEYFRRSLVADTVSGGQNGDHLHPAPSSSQETPPPSGSSSQGRHSYSRSAMLVERRNNSAFGIPYSLRNMNLAVAGEGRSRLVSEMRNVLDLVRRGEGLRFEDVMMLDQSGFFGVADRYDRHRDMRLDVDNMSYEELLALEEHIGNVNTGLSEESILKQLKQHNYINSEAGEEKIEPCCICQEEYNSSEVMGLLDCGHDFHAECIKKWLMLKNLCPICKTTGLNNNNK